MARIKVATSADVDNVQTQVTSIETTVTAPSTGLSDRVTANETAITNTNNIIGADDTSGLRKKIEDNKTAIGDANSGLVKGQNDLFTVVGADNTEGLQKRVVDLESSVGDETTGLIKDTSDNTTAIGDETTGLIKDMTDTQDAIDTLNKIGATAIYRLNADVAIPATTTDVLNILGATTVTLDQEVKSSSTYITVNVNEFTFSEGVWRLEFIPNYRDQNNLLSGDFFRMAFRDVTGSRVLYGAQGGLTGTAGFVQQLTVVGVVDATTESKQVRLVSPNSADGNNATIRGFADNDTRASYFVFTRIG